MVSNIQLTHIEHYDIFHDKAALSTKTNSWFLRIIVRSLENTNFNLSALIGHCNILCLKVEFSKPVMIILQSFYYAGGLKYKKVY
jgi:hypothetical protein